MEIITKYSKMGQVGVNLDIKLNLQIKIILKEPGLINEAITEHKSTDISK